MTKTLESTGLFDFTDAKKRTNGKKEKTPRATTKVAPKPTGMEKFLDTGNLDEVCAYLQNLQRKRTEYIKSRIMFVNRLKALLKTHMGYSSTLPEEERERMAKEANEIIKNRGAGHEMESVICTTYMGIDAFKKSQDALEKDMVKLTKYLPVHDWVEEKEQNGFGLPSLAVLVGETGNISNYSNPAKVWKRMGCAPWSFQGRTNMGSTWRTGKNGKLPADEWEKFGYSPRRRSVAYVIGENLQKQGRVKDEDGEVIFKTPYRIRFEEAKEATRTKHPEWWVCGSCKGGGRTQKGGACKNCDGTGEVSMHTNLHGMLLATKRLLRNLWIEWHK